VGEAEDEVDVVTLIVVETTVLEEVLVEYVEVEATEDVKPAKVGLYI
jgi:hypothetical protein